MTGQFFCQIKVLNSFFNFSSCSLACKIYLFVRFDTPAAYDCFFCKRFAGVFLVYVRYTMARPTLKIRDV